MRERMKGGVPDMNRIKREQQEAERRGQLSCRWDKDRDGRLCYLVHMEDMYGREQKLHRFYDVSDSRARDINSKIAWYNRTHRVFLSQWNPSVSNVKILQKELDGLVNGNER